ncbi:MAG: hypothetical protein DRP66_10675 [Planctomycetota bacterium]|nr:MAG: hypothetical protein DRP66_10675 [Planctomycetota bacterium]
MKRKVFPAMAVLLMCLVLAAQSAPAQPQGRGPRPGRGPGQGGRQGRGRGASMMGRGGGMYEGLDLTEEQKAKIAKIREEIMEKVRNADSPEARRDIYGQMREKIQAVLTDEQREKMAQRFSGGRGREGDRPGGPGRRPGRDASRTRSMGPIQVLDGLLRRLGLNDEQNKKIARIREDAIKKLFKDVKAVLTKEQNAKFDEARKRLRAAQQRRVRGNRPGPGGPPEGRGPRRGEGDRDGGARGRKHDKGGRDREN